MTRNLIIVDVESTGLTPGRHVPIEIAAINTATGEELYIAPYVEPEAWARADPEAMAINRYFERRVFDRIDRGAEADNAALLSTWLDGNTLGGSNPRFDYAMLGLFLDPYEFHTEPHHRLADLSAYAAMHLGLLPTELPGLATVAELLGVTGHGPGPDHTALGDARVTWACFQALTGRRDHA